VKAFSKILLAIIFGFLLLELLILSSAHELNMFKGFRILGVALIGAAIYYLIFERKKK
jgi:hypothetical protein